MPGRRAVVGHGLSPRTTATGMAVSLPLTRSAAAAISSANGDLGDHQLVAVPVDGTRIVVQHSQTRRADGGIDLAVAPGAPHRVGDDHGDGDAEPFAQSGAQRRGAGVRVDWQQRQFVAADVGSVHAGGGLNQSQPVLGDQRSSLARQHAHRLVVDQLAAQPVPAPRRPRGAGTSRPSHLDTTLLVTTTTSPSRSQGAAAAERPPQIVAGPELGKPGDGQDLDRRRRCRARRPAAVGRLRRFRALGTGHAATPARSSPALTISAVASGSLINSGIERTATPSISASSPSCTSQQSRIPVARRAP